MNKDEALKLALTNITKVPTLTHGLLVKLADVETAIKEALLYRKSFAEVHPRNLSATCDCEHWQSCVECHPTAHPQERYTTDAMQVRQAVAKALEQPEQEPVGVIGIPTTEDYAMGYAEGFNDACKPKAQPEQKPVAFPSRRAVERAIESVENPKGMHLNDGKERVILPGGTLRYMLALIDHTSPPQRQPLKRVTIADAPDCLNTNDKAMWVIGWNECAEANGIGAKT